MILSKLLQPYARCTPTVSSIDGRLRRIPYSIEQEALRKGSFVRANVSVRMASILTLLSSITRGDWTPKSSKLHGSSLVDGHGQVRLRMGLSRGGEPQDCMRVNCTCVRQGHVVGRGLENPLLEEMCIIDGGRFMPFVSGLWRWNDHSVLIFASCTCHPTRSYARTMLVSSRRFTRPVASASNA